MNEPVRHDPLNVQVGLTRSVRNVRQVNSDDLGDLLSNLIWSIGLKEELQVLAVEPIALEFDETLGVGLIHLGSGNLGNTIDLLVEFHLSEKCKLPPSDRQERRSTHRHRRTVVVCSEDSGPCS